MMQAMFSRSTPWGMADHYENKMQGIFTCSTPSHGGWFIPPEYLHNISAEGRRYAAKWSGSEQWFEEDCAWAFVCEAFPDLFTEENREIAKRTLGWLKERNLVPSAA